MVRSKNVSVPEDAGEGSRRTKRSREEKGKARVVESHHPQAHSARSRSLEVEGRLPLYEAKKIEEERIILFHTLPDPIFKDLFEAQDWVHYLSHSIACNCSLIKLFAANLQEDTEATTVEGFFQYSTYLEGRFHLLTNADISRALRVPRIGIHINEESTIENTNFLAYDFHINDCYRILYA